MTNSSWDEAHREVAVYRIPRYDILPQNARPSGLSKKRATPGTMLVR